MQMEDESFPDSLWGDTCPRLSFAVPWLELRFALLLERARTDAEHVRLPHHGNDKQCSAVGL